VCGLLCLLATAVRAGELQMHAIIYPPLVTVDNGKVFGVASEVVREVQKLVGNDSELEEAPWLRAYEMTQIGPNQALFAIVRIPEREKLFKWVGPVFGENDYFFMRKGSSLEVNSLEDVRKTHRIAVRKGGYTHQTLVASGFTNLDIGPTYASSYKKLLEGRVDLVLMGEVTYKYMVREAGLNPANFERTKVKYGASSAWLAFSLDVPDEVVDKWQSALDLLKENGVYQQILKRNF